MSASFLKIAHNIDVSPLVAQLDNHPELWDENPRRRNYEGSPHAEMEDIWVRFGVDVEDQDQPHDSEWYPSADALTEAKKIAFQLMHLVNGERLGGVLITKLPPGGKIHPHKDQGWHAAYYEKLYVALTAPESSYFGFEDGKIESNPGDCYLFRNDRIHWVENDSNETRLTMVVCIKTGVFEGI